MLDESPAIPRLGIKKFFWWSEALHGAANMGNVTVFPEPVAMAASFNPDLLYKCFDVASTEFRAQYNHRMYDQKGEDEKFHSLSVWTPNVNIFRDPRWGRGQETYGEDPYLTSVMGVQVVKGLQGPETAKYRKLWACAKHYAVHSGPEYTRHSANLTDVSPRDMWETYMPAFKTLVQDAKVRDKVKELQKKYKKKKETGMKYSGSYTAGNRTFYIVKLDNMEVHIADGCWQISRISYSEGQNTMYYEFKEIRSGLFLLSNGRAKLYLDRKKWPKGYIAMKMNYVYKV